MKGDPGKSRSSSRPANSRSAKTQANKHEKPAAEAKSASHRVTFDGAYYEQFYFNPKSQVSDEVAHHRLVASVVGLVEHFGLEVRTVLDVGAGVGRWGSWFRAHRPEVRVRSTEMDPDICKQFGHEQRDITRWQDPQRFDLVICQGVLPYLDDTGATAAIENLAQMTDGFLYLEAITRHDVREVVDRTKTDLRVFARPGSFYRSRLKPHFRTVGAGLFAARDAGISFFELEAST